MAQSKPHHRFVRARLAAAGDVANVAWPNAQGFERADPTYRDLRNLHDVLAIPRAWQDLLAPNALQVRPCARRAPQAHTAR